MRTLILPAVLLLTFSGGQSPAQIHVSDPPAVFRAEVNGMFHCYPMPAPEGSKALWCDVEDPATREKFVVAFINQGSASVMRAK